MVRVYGRADSSNVQKAMWTCAELGVEVERIDIGGKFGGNREPGYLAKNPNGLIPTLEDGDVVLWESHAIIRYLCEKFGPEPLYPVDPARRGLVNQWMDWMLSTLNPPMGIIFMGLVRTPPEKRDMAAIDAAVKKAAEFWTLVEAHLADRPFLAGDAPTLAEIVFGPSLHRWHTLDIETPELPNVRALYDRLGGIQGYRQYMMLPLT